MKNQITQYYNSLALNLKQSTERSSHFFAPPNHSEEILNSLPESASQLFNGCGTPLVHAPMDSASRVVDLGCGAGRDVFLASEMAKEHSVIVGIDISPAMIESALIDLSSFALKDRSIIFRVADIERYPMPRNFADVVISNNTLHLCPDLMAVYRNIFRALKHDGTVVFCDIVQANNFDNTAIKCLPEEHDHISAMQALSFVEVEIVDRQYFSQTQTHLIREHIFPHTDNGGRDGCSPESGSEIYAITLRAKRPPFSC